MKFWLYLRGAKISMVPGRRMSLAPRDPMLSLGCTMQVTRGAFQLLGTILGSQGGHEGHPRCLLAWGPCQGLGDRSWFWEQSWETPKVPPCLGTTLGSHGPSLGIRYQGSPQFGDHPGV